MLELGECAKGVGELELSRRKCLGRRGKVWLIAVQEMPVLQLPPST